MAKTELDIQINIPEEKKTFCEICCKTFKNPNALAGHIGAGHRVKFEDYLVKYYNDNKKPECPTCGKNTKFVRGEYSFKMFCVEHANDARIFWSSNKGFGKNGFNNGWRKGLTKETNELVAKQAAAVTGKNNPSFLTEEQFNNKKQIILENAINFDITYEKYTGEDMPINAFCTTCSRTIIKKFKNLFDNPSCPSCSSGKSKEEQEIFNYVQTLCKESIRGERNAIEKELDIFIPSKNFAIEYNGLFWHISDKIGRSYHSNKTKLCEDKGINLFHIFSDEWKERKDIVKSMINNRIGTIKNKIYARNCVINETTSNLVLRDFFDTTHISYNVQFSKGFYLTYDNEIVCALSLRKSHYKKYEGYIEIARFSSKLNTNVIGGFSKLLKVAKNWAIQNGYKGIITYADLRFGKGKVYENNGFQLVSKTDVDYWYTDFKQRYNRFKFRAQPGKPEKIVAEESGVYKIYGCGSNIYEMKF